MKRGDVFLIESGQVHAIGSDLIVVEIGQNSNTTYRICDYGRGREMHLDDALNVINIDLPARRSPGLTSDFGDPPIRLFSA